jgi:iron complex outermembrane receptor protein
VTGVAPVRNPNPHLKWERTAETNVALDYGVLENRFTGSLEYYVKNTSDLLLTVSVPQPAPVDTVLQNVGKLRNQGVEFSLDSRIYDRERMHWSAGLVFSAERNKVVDLGGRSFITTGGVSGQGQSGQVSERIMPGHPLGTFFGPRFVRVAADTRIVGTDTIWRPGQQLFACSSTRATCVSGLTTTPAGEDYGVIGNANPDFTIGLHSEADWGRFDFSFLVRGAFGQDVFNNTALVYSTKGNALQDKNFLASALNDPTGIHEPAIFSSRWIENASFVRLQNVTLGYTFDLPRIGGLAGRTTRLYVSGDNLLLLTDYSGYDPEVHAEAGLASRGIDYLSYPRPRTFTVGTRISF